MHDKSVNPGAWVDRCKTNEQSIPINVHFSSPRNTQNTLNLNVE